MGKIGTEQKYNFGNFTFKIGTTDKKNATVIYADGGVFIEPVDKCDNYLTPIKNVLKDLRRTVSDIVDKNDDFNSFIMNCDVSKERIMYNKRTYLSMQFYFRQRHNKPYTEIAELLKAYLDESVETIDKNIHSEGFLCYKTKK